MIHMVEFLSLINITIILITPKIQFCTTIFLQPSQFSEDYQVQCSHNSKDNSQDTQRDLEDIDEHLRRIKAEKKLLPA